MGQQITQEPVSPAASQPEAGEPAVPRKTAFAGMALGSLGVVFGDIGTSPLYALRESLNHIKAAGVTDGGVIGTISLLMWALFFTVTAKYVLFLMHADNRAKAASYPDGTRQSALGHAVVPVFFLGVAGRRCFRRRDHHASDFGPLGHRGLELVTPIFSPYILPITILILVSLLAQRRAPRASLPSSAHHGGFFLVIGVLARPISAMRHASFSPSILSMACDFCLATAPRLRRARLRLPCGNRAEALYADMGHFGRAPIQTAWILFVLPALSLNYLGQGALVLANPAAVDNPFSCSRRTGLFCPRHPVHDRDVIASQAVITGAFSLVRQAIQLGLLPRMLILHTSETQEGQIFLPRINRLLLIGVLVLCLCSRVQVRSPPPME